MATYIDSMKKLILGINMCVVAEVGDEGGEPESVLSSYVTVSSDVGGDVSLDDVGSISECRHAASDTSLLTTFSEHESSLSALSATSSLSPTDNAHQASCPLGNKQSIRNQMQ